MGGAQFRREREHSSETFVSESRPEGQESETLRTRIAGELRSVDRMLRIARPVALVVFTLLGLLAVLQLYTWSRVEQLSALSQRREERVAAALASMQETIDRHRLTLDEAAEHPASPGRSHKQANLEAREASEPSAPVAVRELAKPGKASREPQPAVHQAPPRPVDLRPAPAPQTAAPPAPDSQQNVPPAHPSTRIEFQSTASNRLDLAAGRAEEAMPGGQGASARQGGEAGRNDQHDVAEAPGVRVTQADTVIARDHNEIERLRKLGRRDYIEFTLVRAGNRQEVAPDIRLELKKVDSKRLRCAVNIYAEDYEYPTDLGINEPVVFPVRAMWESVELVINKVGKDTVGGYLTARKGVLAAR